MKGNKIPDYFGAYIGGARRDEWTEGIGPKDLDVMNTKEIRKYVNRDAVWPLPNAVEAVESGEEPFLVYWKRIVRRTSYRSPYIVQGDDIRAKSKKYVEQMQMLRSYVDDVKEEGQIHLFYYKAATTELSDCVSEQNLKATHHQLSRYRHKCIQSGFPYQERKRPSSQKVTFIPPQLEDIHREGEDYREGISVTPEIWQNTFQFRGIEFGNWMNQRDRQFSLDYAYDALKDLGEVLQIEDRDLSFDGKMALAFGSRGRCGAAAHFEPMRQVINLTKMHGAGSTAHEWCHSLDYFLAREFGISDSALASESKELSKLPSCFNKLVYSLKKDASGNETDFLKGSSRWDEHFKKDGFGYWSSDCEMLARAFACYTKDTLGCKSDYLFAHADVYVHQFDDQYVSAIPQGEEREILNEKFDQLFYDLKEMGFFHERTELSEQKLKPGIPLEVDTPENQDSSVRFFLSGDGQIVFSL